MDQSDLDLIYFCVDGREARQSVQTYICIPLAPSTGNKNRASSRNHGGRSLFVFWVTHYFI